jgi:hypothetical protein
LGINNTFGIACVADGHGGSKYFRSQKGASLAVDAARRSLHDYHGEIAGQKTAFFNFNKKAKSEKQYGQEITASLKQLERSIIYQWRNDVKDDLEKNPLTEKEKEICKAENIEYDDPSNLTVLYGTTLAAALVSDSFWFVLQIGDGCAVVIDSGGSAFVPPELEDKRLGFGRTTSLCDSDAADNFRECFGADTILGLTAATDGVADSFEPEKYLRFNKYLYNQFDNFPSVAEYALRDFLPELSERGSGDDAAIAGIFRMEE